MPACTASPRIAYCHWAEEFIRHFGVIAFNCGDHGKAPHM